MSEWGVVGVIIALAGLGATIGGPIIQLVKSITKLTAVVDHLDKELKEQKEQSAKSHTKLWAHNVEQDNKIEDHEKRIYFLEHAKED